MIKFHFYYDYGINPKAFSSVYNLKYINKIYQKHHQAKLKRLKAIADEYARTLKWD